MCCNGYIFNIKMTCTLQNRYLYVMNPGFPNMEHSCKMWCQLSFMEFPEHKYFHFYFSGGSFTESPGRGSSIGRDIKWSFCWCRRIELLLASRVNLFLPSIKNCAIQIICRFTTDQLPISIHKWKESVHN